MIKHLCNSSPLVKAKNTNTMGKIPLFKKGNFPHGNVLHIVIGNPKIGAIGGEWESLCIAKAIVLK
jgi:hypothetical protein